MDFKIAVLAGDGIGPEISAVGVDVMTAVCEKFGHKVSYEYAVVVIVPLMSRLIAVYSVPFTVTFSIEDTFTRSARLRIHAFHLSLFDCAPISPTDTVDPTMNPAA